MKKLPLGNLCGIALIFVAICAAIFIGISDYSDKETQEIFCKENGYDDVNRGILRGQEDFCISEENNIIIKKEISSCKDSKLFDKSWCFVEVEK